MEVERYLVPDAEEQWAAWEARCQVSHAGHFAPARNDEAALHRLQKPMSALRVALATSGGAYVVGMDPFDMTSRGGDDSVRWIPSDVDTGDLRFAHDHYDHTDPDRDPNCMLPLARLRELVEQEVVGEAAPAHLGFMGWIPDPTRFVRETIPNVVARLKEESVDAVIISPG